MFNGSFYWQPADMSPDLTLLCSLQYHLVCMKAAIYHHKFIILGRLYKLSSLPPLPLCQHSQTHPTLHQDLAPTTILQQPATLRPHYSSLHTQLELPVLQHLLCTPRTPNSLQSQLALSHPHLFLPHQYLHSRLPLSLQHLKLYRLWPHLSHQCRQQVAPAVGIVYITECDHVYVLVTIDA